MDTTATSGIPWFGARKLARHLSIEVEHLREERDEMRRRLETLGVLSVTELEERKKRPSRNDADGAAASTSPHVADHVVGLKELARETAKATEQAVLKRTLRQVQWRRVTAARRLGISYKTLLDKIKRYGLDLGDS